MCILPLEVPTTLQKAGGNVAGRLEREVAAKGAEIDKLVYELYEVADNERRIIEGA